MRIQNEPLDRLCQALRKLPGIGARTAQRLAFHLLKAPRDQVEALAAALTELRDSVSFCSQCCNLTTSDPCAVCADPSRDRSILCVVEEPANVASIERTGRFRGLYHVLHGSLSPMHGVGPEQLRIAELCARLEGVKEVIIATNPTADGEATAVYLARALRPAGVTVSRIGMGVPVGSELDYIDNVTLSRAIEGRRTL